MPRKRKNRGRNKGGKGREPRVQCGACGALVPRSKATKVTRRFTPVDPQLAKELRRGGSIIPSYSKVRYLCVNCAVYQKVVRIRSAEDRKKATALR